MKNDNDKINKRITDLAVIFSSSLLPRINP